MPKWNIDHALRRHAPRILHTRLYETIIPKNDFDNKTPQTRLDCCYQVAASAVKEYGDIYLGIFERLHIEIEKRKTNNSLLNEAFTVAKSIQEDDMS